MKSMVKRYMQWRQKTFPASKYDVSWRHEHQDARSLDVIRALEQIQNSLGTIEGLLEIQSNDREQCRYTAAAISSAAIDNRLVIYDYPVRTPSSSYKNTNGAKHLENLFKNSENTFSDELEKITSYLRDLKSISVQATPNAADPYYINGWLPGLDSMYLYTLIRTRQPRTYLEIGSGNSTKFVRKAIKDGNLGTKIISIDPFPRAEIDHICDYIIREPFETVDESQYLSLLRAGDVVFVDNSHVCYQGSDVTKFFTDTISALPKGIIYGIHDIFLPYEYPAGWALRFYSEQYLLAAYLLGGAGGDKVLFPGNYISRSEVFESTIEKIFMSSAFNDVERHAGAFWLERSI
jgi:hypothetical protein